MVKRVSSVAVSPYPGPGLAAAGAGWAGLGRIFPIIVLAVLRRYEAVMLHGLVGHLQPALHLRREAPAPAQRRHRDLRPAGSDQLRHLNPLDPLAHFGDAAVDLLIVLGHLVGGSQHRQLHPKVVPILLGRFALRRGLAPLVAMIGELVLQQQGLPQRLGDRGDPLAIVGAGLRRLHRLGAGRLHDLHLDLGRPGEHAQMPRRPLLLGSGRGFRHPIGLRLVHGT
ncbi:hypothetical protein [Inquilinus ginsengisoli]|uniref:hypothetical protein n=1 Tax=Inquilinus ginsengisoli TaxID=363840 RepID=UPI003D218EE2